MTGTSATFKAAMIQMRAGLSPAANLDDVSRMIGEGMGDPVNLGRVMTWILMRMILLF